MGLYFGDSQSITLIPGDNFGNALTVTKIRTAGLAGSYSTAPGIARPIS